MKIKIDDFRFDQAKATEAPLDFQALCAQLAASQAGTTTARLARGGELPQEQPDYANPAVSILLGVSAQPTVGSFHAAAAARVNGEER